MKLNIILQEVNHHLKINIKDSTRRREYVYGRNLFMRLAKDLNPWMSLSTIGKFINKDHATIIHGLRQFDNIKNYNQDKDYIDSYKSLLILLKNKKFVSLNGTENRTQIIIRNQAPLREFYAKPIQ